MCTDSIIAKIQNLLNKTEENGASAAEAASAVAIAQKLMAKYGITLEEVKEESEETQIKEENVSVGTKSVSSIQAQMAMTLAEHFGCHTLRKSKADGSQYLVFVGEAYKSGALKACYLFSYNAYQALSNKFMRTLPKEMSSTDKSQSRWDYFHGFMDGLTNELIKSENENALVVVESQAVKDYLSKMTLKKTTITNRMVMSYLNREKGYQDGSYAFRNKKSLGNE